MSIIIGGDLVPTVSNEKLFINGNKRELIGDELIDIFDDIDYRIFNLETPLVDKESPIIKSGPTLFAKTGTVAGIKCIGANLLTLANNHIMDQGKSGIDSTIKVLHENDIQFVGVGDNVREAGKPIFFNHNKVIGVIACAEHEFSIAGENLPGAYGFDPIDFFDLIHNTKEKCDYLIILYHGGKEYYRYPSPFLRKICRKMIDSGANLIVCQHSHCIGCKEEYNSGTIVYGQGNFIFDFRHDDFWSSSLLIKINDDCSLEYIPIVQNGVTIRLANLEERNEILKGFNERSIQIIEPGFVESNYSAFANENVERYLFDILCKRKSLLFRVLNKLSKRKYGRLLLFQKYNTQNLAVLENYIECEAHRELLLKGIKNRLYGKN